MGMYRYTTPTIPCKLEGVNFAAVDYVRVALEGKESGHGQAKKTVVHQIPASDFDDEGVCLLRLTQEETAAFGEGSVYIQCRVKFRDGNVLSTKKIITTISDVIDKAVI